MQKCARSDYARGQGVNFAIRQANDKPAWNTSAVSSILHNRMYAGDMVYGRHRCLEAAGRSKKVPKEEVQIVENAHPAIISREDFKMAEKKLERNVKSGKGPWGQKRVHERHALAGKVLCGNCGHEISVPSEALFREYGRICRLCEVGPGRRFGGHHSYNVTDGGRSVYGSWENPKSRTAEE